MSSPLALYALDCLRLLKQRVGICIIYPVDGLRAMCAAEISAVFCWTATSKTANFLTAGKCMASFLFDAFI